MDSVGDTVCYCCIWKGGRVLYTYSVGNDEIDNLAALCLEMIPPYHSWYFETAGKKTFGFLMDEGFVYMAIVVCESCSNSQVLRFLQKLRDEFRRMGKRTSFSSLDSLCLQEQLLPVVHHLEPVSGTGTVWGDEGEPTPSPCNNASGASTKAPLLGKPSKAEKKKMKEDLAIEMEEHRRSTDRGVRMESGADFRSISNSNLQRKWCRQVRIVLAIDAAVCAVLFVIWLVICHGVECIR